MSDYSETERAGRPESRSNKPFTVLVCGGRNFSDLRGNWWGFPSLSERKKQYNFVHETLDRLTRENKWPVDNGEYDGFHFPTWKLITGGARGVDSTAIDYAIVNWMPFQEFIADWDNHGRAAGPIRNKKMLDEGRPDVVVAFPGDKGTANMIKQAKKAGVPVIEVEYEKT